MFTHLAKVPSSWTNDEQEKKEVLEARAQLLRLLCVFRSLHKDFITRMWARQVARELDADDGKGSEEDVEAAVQVMEEEEGEE